MYYIIYPLFYLISLLPWRAIYGLSALVYLLIYHLFGYRKKVVFNNLTIAFPDKTETEKIAIAKKFYRNFTDTFLETIKLLSVSAADLKSRVACNAEVINDLFASGQSVQLHLGHFFNWEFANLGIAAHLKGYKFLGVYAPPENKAMHRIIVKLRSKCGTILIPNSNFKTLYRQYAKEPYVLGLVADQNPSNPNNAYWTPFFNRLTPFVTGPEKGARSMNTAVVEAQFYRVKRGYYRLEYQLLTTTPKALPEGSITTSMVHFVENAIRTRPDNYLWSHRRWKHQFNAELHKALIIK
jgi:Kdo2-lipid IVA lauroyltransferase/acyltransferase